jgi:hypothetical protein
MAKAAQQINTLAGSQRALNQGNLAPNHYWDKDRPTQIDKPRPSSRWSGNQSIQDQLLEVVLPHRSGRPGNGFQCDDDNAQWFIEESRKRGIKTHQRAQGLLVSIAHARPLANPKDMEKAALRNPDFNFVVYHSAIKHGKNEQGMDWRRRLVDKDHNL